MKQLRHIALALIVLTISSPTWAMVCATHCAHDHAAMTQTATDSCCNDHAHHQDQDPNAPCTMAATCHFASSPAIGMRTQALYETPHAFAPQLAILLPPSADKLPLFKPPQ